VGVGEGNPERKRLAEPEHADTGNTEREREKERERERERPPILRIVYTLN